MEPTQVIEPAKPSKFPLILLSVLLILSISTNAYLFHQNQELKLEATELTFTPTSSVNEAVNTAKPDLNAELYTYTRETAGPQTIATDYPANQKFQNIDHQYEITFPFLVNISNYQNGYKYQSENHTLIITAVPNRYEETLTNYLHLDYNKTKTITLSNQPANYYEIKSYCNGSCHSSISIVTIHENMIYTLDLYGDTTLSPEEAQILSNFKFTNGVTQKSTSSPQQPSTIRLSYSLPEGWLTFKDQTNSFEIGYDPNIIEQIADPDRIMFRSTTGTQSLQSVFKLTAYNSGSRHAYLEQHMGEPLGESDKLPDFKEVEYLIQGKRCLVYDGYAISMNPNVWGMCPITSNTALFFNLWRGNHLETIKTIKFL
jgi:hypothetical protein